MLLMHIRKNDIVRITSNLVEMNHIELIHIDLNEPLCDSHQIDSHWVHSDPYQHDSYRLRLIANLPCPMGPVDKGLRLRGQGTNGTRD